MRVATALEGLEGIASIADDVLIYDEGETDEEADVNHDIHLVQLMERCKERYLKLNLKKFKFKLPQLKFMGHWSSDRSRSNRGYTGHTRTGRPKLTITLSLVMYWSHCMLSSKRTQTLSGQPASRGFS